MVRDFITVDPAKVKNIGVVLGPGIQSIEIETVWGGHNCFIYLIKM